MNKRFFLSALIIGFVFSNLSLATAYDKQSFSPSTLQTDGRDRIFSIGGSTGFGFSQLGIWPNKLCKSTKDPVCDFTQSEFQNRVSATAMLELCQSKTDNDCIESVEVSDNGLTFRKLIFEKYMPDGFLSPTSGNSFPSDSNLNLPKGGLPSIWTEIIDGQVSQLKYLVYYKYEMKFNQAKNRFEPARVALAATPFKESSSLVWSSLWTDGLLSGIQYDFNPETVLQITVRVSKQPSGWFKARMKDIDIQISPYDESNNRLIVKGSAVSTPNFAVVKRMDSLNSTEEELAAHFGYSKGAVTTDPSDPKIFEYVDYWRSYLKDIASYTTTSWNIESTTWSSDNRCLQDSKRVLGVVATNAMGFDGNAPKFINGFLDYRVTGFHFKSDGVTPNLGTYDLVIRSDAARCLYGFSNAPVSAQVFVSSSNGINNIATTVVSEKNGWLNMKAVGFTFSEKILKVKISQAKNQRYTINCIKGSSSKKIVGVKPRCPKGYKSL
jgi:hypothetical protein